LKLTLQHVTAARTAKFAHMNGHWKTYDFGIERRGNKR